MGKRVKVNYDRGYEYKSAQTARGAYANAIALIRANRVVRATCSRGDLFLIRNDI